MNGISFRVESCKSVQSELHMNLQLSIQIYVSRFLVIETSRRWGKHISTHTLFKREAKFHMDLQLFTRDKVHFTPKFGLDEIMFFRNGDVQEER